MAIDIVILLISLITATVLQVGILFGGMYAVTKFAGDKFGETTYGKLDFDNFQTSQLSEISGQLAVIIGVPTIVFHFIDFLYRHILIVPLGRQGFIWGVALLILTTATTFLGLLKLARIDQARSGILAAISAFFYIPIYYYFLAGKLY